MNLKAWEPREAMAAMAPAPWQSSPVSRVSSSTELASRVPSGESAREETDGVAELRIRVRPAQTSSPVGSGPQTASESHETVDRYRRAMAGLFYGTEAPRLLRFAELNHQPSRTMSSDASNGAWLKRRLSQC